MDQFHEGREKRGRKAFGQLNGEYYPIEDERAIDFYHKWNNFSVPQLVKEVLGDFAFWGTDLNALPGFTHAVTEKVEAFLNKGGRAVLESAPPQRVLVQWGQL